MCFCSIVWGTTVRLERCPPLSHQPLWSIQTQMQSKQKVRERPWICDEMWEKFMGDKYTTEKLRWHWKIPMFNRKYFFEWWISIVMLGFRGVMTKYLYHISYHHHRHNSKSKMNNKNIRTLWAFWNEDGKGSLDLTLSTLIFFHFSFSLLQQKFLWLRGV